MKASTLVLLSVFGAFALSACPATTWSAATDDALSRVASDPTDPELATRAGELALLAASDPERSESLLLSALSRTSPREQLRGRAALALAHLGTVSERYDLLHRAIVAGADGAEAAVVEALIGMAGALWGRVPGVPAVPEDLAAALRRVAGRSGAAWEPARTEARRQLLTAAELSGSDEELAAARRAAGIIARWRLSAPWGITPDLDLDRALGPETRPLAAEEVTGDGFAKRRHKTWTMTFSDGELAFPDMPRSGGIGFAESWISVPGPERRVVVRVESNRALHLYANGRRVMANDRQRRRGPWEQRVGLTLPNGWTRLTVKLSTHTGTGFASVLVSRLDGGEVSLSVAPPAGSVPPDSTVGTFRPPDGFVELFPRDFAEPSSEHAVQALHRFEALVHRPLRDGVAATDQLEALARQLPRYDGVGLARARLAAVDSSLTRAVARGLRRQAFEEVLKRWPDNVRALRGLARVNREEEQFGKAVELWRRALTIAPRHTGALFDLLAVYSDRRWEAQALELARRLEGLGMQSPRVLQEVVDAYEAFYHPSAARAAAERLAELFPRSAEVRLAHMAGAAGRLEDKAARLMGVWRRQPQRFDLAHSAAAAYRAAGKPRDAGRVAAEVLEMRPEDPWALSERVRIALGHGDRAQLDAAVDAVLAAHPDMLRFEILRAWLAGESEPLARDVIDARKLVGSWRARASGEGGPDYSGHPVVTLLDREAHQIRRDGVTLSLEHTVHLIGSKVGADALGELRPPPGARLLAVRTIRADGSVLWPDRVPGKPDLSFSGLVPGDAVEWAWLVRSRIRPEEGGYLGGISFGSRSGPIVTKRVDVIVPPSFELEPRLQNEAPAPLVEPRPDGTKVYSWRSKDLPPVPREPFASGLRTFFPYVDLTAWPKPAPTTDEGAWRAIARGYAGRLERLTRPGVRTRRVAKELLSKSSNDRVGAVWAGFDYVKQEINRSERFNTFETDAERALALQKGNRTVVLLALAKVLKQDARVLLCAPRRFGPEADAARPVPNANRFYYPVTRIESEPAGPIYYADPARPYNPFGVLPRSLYGSRCLDPTSAARAKGPIFMTLPPYQTYRGRPVRWSFVLELEVDETGRASGTLVGSAFGPPVSGLRQVYLRASEQRRRVLWQQWVSSILPGAKVLGALVADPRDADKPMRWELELEIRRFLNRDRDGLSASRVLPPLLADSLAAVPALERLVALPARKTPVALHAHEESVELRLVVPSGKKLDTGLADLALELSSLQARQQVRLEGTTLTVERQVSVAPGRVPPRDYAEFRAKLAEALDALSRGLTVR